MDKTINEQEGRLCYNERTVPLLHDVKKGHRMMTFLPFLM